MTVQQVADQIQTLIELGQKNAELAVFTLEGKTIAIGGITADPNSPDERRWVIMLNPRAVEHRIAL